MSLSAIAQSPGEQIAAYGRVSPGERAIVVGVPYYQSAPQILGTLAIQEGEMVTKGQKLGETTSRPLASAELAAAKAQLATAEERLKAVSAGPKAGDIAAQEAMIRSLLAEAKSAKARKRPDTTPSKQEYAAHEEALDWKVTSAQRQLDALREVRPADLAVAQAQVREAEATLRKAEALLAQTEITSPIDGQVLKILTYPGEGAARGLLEVGDTQRLVIKAELSVADAARVAVGGRATLKSNAWPGAIEGTVSRIDSRVERSALTAPSTFANVDRQVVEATITPAAAAKLSARPGSEVTVLISPQQPVP